MPSFALCVQRASIPGAPKAHVGGVLIYCSWPRIVALWPPIWQSVSEQGRFSLVSRECRRSCIGHCIGRARSYECLVHKLEAFDLMRWSLKIARIAGTEVIIHITFLLFLAWIGFSYYQVGGAAAAVPGVLFVLALFGCV